MGAMFVCPRNVGGNGATSPPLLPHVDKDRVASNTEGKGERGRLGEKDAVFRLTRISA